MSDRLKRDDFVDSAPNVRGEQVHIHHCKGGKNNDKLYIRRNEDDSIVAYCHHCNQRGYARDNYVPNVYDQIETKNGSSGIVDGDTDTRISQLRRYREETESAFTKDNRFRTQPWVVRSGLTDTKLDALQVKCVDARLWFPLFNPKGDISILCGRGLENVEPKWLIYKQHLQRIFSLLNQSLHYKYC